MNDITPRADALIHLLCEVWTEDGKIQGEILSPEVFCEYDLLLDLPREWRPITDWVSETIDEIEIEFFLPENFEVCEEVLLYEVIGRFSISAYKDYWGDYDEEYDFEIIKWSCDYTDDD